jgi:hypothetical protein
MKACSAGFPIAIMLIVLLATWLGIFGPLPNGVMGWITQWQSLIAASVALFAAYIAYQNANRTIKNNSKLETSRRQQKHESTRAVLPLVLTKLNQYAEDSANSLKLFAERHVVANRAPTHTFTDAWVKELPIDTFEALAEFIEYADSINTQIVSDMIAFIQIYDSRTRGHVQRNCGRDAQEMLSHDIQNLIVDAASIYAAASALYDYARRRTHSLESTISWENVRNALGYMRFWPEENVELFEGLERRERVSTSPFDTLRKR